MWATLSYPKSGVFLVARLPQSDAFRRSEVRVVRPCCQSSRPRAQLCRRSDSGRPPGSGHGNGVRPGGCQGDFQSRKSSSPTITGFLNYEVPPFDNLVPTAENIVRDIWRRLNPHFSGSEARLHSVRLYETEDLFVDYFGDNAGYHRDEMMRHSQVSVFSFAPSACSAAWGREPRTLREVQ